MSIHLHAAEGDDAALLADLDRGIPIDVRDGQGRTPLMVAAASPAAHGSTLRLLLDGGADANAMTVPSEPVKLNAAAREMLEEQGMDTSLFDAVETVRSSDSVLGYAVKESATVDKLRILVEAGADARYVNSNGLSVLTYAVYRWGSQSVDAWGGILALLVRAGAPLDVISRYGESALSVASNRGNFALVAWLLQHGADPAPLDWPPLFHEIAAGNTEGVIKQLENGAPLDARDAWSRTPFLLALHAGHREIAELLLARGSDRLATGRCGRTALMHAISRDDAAMLEWLILNGFDVEEADDFGQFPLLEAARAGAAKSVQALLEAGASADRRTKHGSNAINETESVEVISSLVAAGQDLSEVGSEMRVKLLELQPSARPVAVQDYRRHRLRVFGRGNPERMNNPLWDWLVTCRISAYECAAKHGDTDFPSEPRWCFRRFGQSITQLPDGRYVEIGGEHEDSYDPDFCIYNDLAVHGNGAFELYGYPQDVFPTTDFHSATLVWPHIYVIGNLGYPAQRRPGETPVYRVDCNSWSIERLQCWGHAPGWIHRHRARLIGNRISICGGQIDDGAGDSLIENTAEFVLDLAELTWMKPSPAWG